jgi:amino acid adenylation domain-containing protein
MDHSPPGHASPMIYLLQHYLSASASRYPDRIAIHTPEGTLSYAQLEARSNRLANLLRHAGVRRGDRVCFVLPRGLDAFVAVFGILKADAIYVAVNPKTPVDRLEFILRNCECRHLIVNNTTRDKAVTLSGRLPGLHGVDLSAKQAGHQATPGLLEYFAEDLDAFDPTPGSFFNIDIDLAYVLYTSGSTGTPKGVMLSHRNVTDYAEWAYDYFGIAATDRIANTSGLYFDLSVFELYCGIKSGAAVYVLPDRMLMFPNEIVAHVDKEEITVWNSVPSLMTYMAKIGVLDRDKCGALTTVLFCGEVMPTKTIIDWMTVYPEKGYFNLYGPTETTCESMVYPIRTMPADPTVPLPIGKACANTEVFALTEDGKVAAVGVEGELYIRGSSVGMGYWKDAAKTAASFIDSPLNTLFPDRIYGTGDLVKLRADGNYEFIGRKDTQIKYMGHRIELGDIESALGCLPYVTETAVIATADAATESTKIVAFVFLNRPTPVESIKNDLREKLPPYMTPKEIRIVDAPLGRTPNGKIDRRSLADSVLAER